MRPTIIVKIGINDIVELQKVGKQTFQETFAESNSEENMNSYLEEGFSLEKLTQELNNENSEFYFVKTDNEIIGYLKVNFRDAQTELIDDKGFEIERIYVLKEYHGKKVGQLLYDKAIEIAKGKEVDFVWLGVWEHNNRAIRFYEKNGFIPFDKHVFKVGDDEQIDIMMKLKLNK
ncbi:Acetyltransferase [Flavobacterium daejeonense]|nr:Acetyltransferase [Flavobacterium daejeonense]